MACAAALLRIAVLAALAATLGGCVAGDHQRNAGESLATPFEVVLASNADWGALNPARGAAGPRAADLWGDRTLAGATGFLVKFAEGFSSPPHIHNVTYRGLVIEGLIHNDDPGAANSWMAPGSYWTQPAGEVHITSARSGVPIRERMGGGGDGERIAYIEIQSGPYLVRPAAEAIDTGERAINVHAANLVWLDASTTSRIRLARGVSPVDGPRVSYLWGDPQDDRPGGALVEVPPRMRVSVASGDPMMRLVVITGRPLLHRGGESPELEPGSYVGPRLTGEGRRDAGEGGSSVVLSIVEGGQAAWVYVRCAGPFMVSAMPAEQ